MDTKMGVSIDTWRARIGGYFAEVYRASMNMAAIKVGRCCVHITLLFVYIFIALSDHTQCPNEGEAWPCLTNWLPYTCSTMLEPGLEGLCSEWTHCGIMIHHGTMPTIVSQSVNCRLLRRLLP